MPLLKVQTLTVVLGGRNLMKRRGEEWFAIMTGSCRYEVLAAVRSLRSRHGRDVFKLDEIVQEVYARGSSYKESTIRTHVSSRLCVNAPDNHDAVYDDLERVSPGHYRLKGT